MHASGVVASGGLDNAVSIYVLNNEEGSGALKKQMTGHDGYVSGIKFIDAQKVARYISFPHEFIS
jgi:hypothetical protein